MRKCNRIEHFNLEVNVEPFYGKELQKTNQTEFRTYIKNVTKYMLNGKVVVICLISEWIKKLSS